MSKICFISDLHCHNFGEFSKTVTLKGKPINSRLFDLLNTLETTFKSAHKRGCKHIVVLGDVFHLRGQVPTDVLQYTYQLFDWAANVLNMHIVILTGNHDQADKAGKIHSIYSFKHIARIVDKPSVVQVGDDRLYMIPYCPTEQLKESLSWAEIEAAKLHPSHIAGHKILCLHAGIDGSTVGSMEYRIKDPITVDDLPTGDFDQVLLGHYHKPQKLASNVRYVGSPVQHTRAEIGDTKRWILWDNGTISSIKTKAKQFYAIGSSNLKDPKSTFIWFSPGYYDITIDDDQTVDEAMALVYSIEGHEECMFKVASLKYAATKKARIKVTATTTDEVLLKKYLKRQVTDPVAIPNITELHAVGLDYLRRATNNQTAKTSLLFNQLDIKNFLSIESAHLNLIRPGSVVSVVGENEDVDSFKSNGAGKSALLPESIYWCLFGETARGIPADKVVNNIKKRDCHVRLSLQCDNMSIVVERYRKHSELGTGVSLFVQGKDVTQGKVADTERMLWQMLGLDYTTFSSIVAFSPANLQFVSSTDADQKRVLDSILQTSRFAAALDLVKFDAKALKTSRQNGVEALRLIEGQIETLRANLADYRTENSLFEEREATRQKNMNQAIRVEQDKLRKLKTLLKAVEQTAKESQVAVDNHILPDVSELMSEQATLNRHLGGLQADVKQLKKDIVANQAQLDEAANQAGKPCPLCGQPVTNTAKLLAKLSTDRNTLNTKLDSTQTKVAAVQGQLKLLEIDLTAFEDSQEELSRLQKENSKNHAFVQTTKTNILAKETGIQNLTVNLNTPAVNEYATKLIPTAKAKLSTAKKELAKTQETIQDIDTQLFHLNFWTNGFGNAGVKSFLFDQIIPELTEYANYYVEKLAGDSIRIEFSTHAEGAVKDKFSIQAWNSEGSDLYIGNSSGERRRIDLCVMLSLFRVANARVKLSMLLMDEVFDTLDSVGIESVVSVLEELATDLDLTIFVTSHTELSNMLHESITIRKVNGLATLVDN